MIHPCSIVRDPNTSACELNHDFKTHFSVGSPTENFSQITLNNQSKFFFHVKFAKLLILKFSLMILKLKLSMDGHKHLGLTLDTKLTFCFYYR